MFLLLLNLMFSKISNILGNAWDWGKSVIKPLKNTVSNGYEMIKNGAMKAGKFVADNHEAIGNIMGGIGNIINSLPNSQFKQKLENGLGDASVAVNKFSNLRPSNTQRIQFKNDMTNNKVDTPQIQMQQQNKPINNSSSGSSASISAPVSLARMGHRSRINNPTARAVI